MRKAIELEAERDALRAQLAEKRKPLTDTEKAVKNAQNNLLYWVERAVDKGNANTDIEDAMEEYNTALATARAIGGKHD